MSALRSTVQAAGVSRWLIRAERSVGGQAAKGEVLIRGEGAPDPDHPPHAALAAARAWLAGGEWMLEAGDVEVAIGAARAGLSELGRDYAPPLVKDDTEVKLLVAADRLEQGHAADAAEVMLRMLRIRSEMYAERHASTVVR